MLPVPLLPEAERIQPLSPVYGKHAIQVVNLMLE
jgi:hypothetical protein